MKKIIITLAALFLAGSVYAEDAKTTENSEKSGSSTEETSTVDGRSTAVRLATSRGESGWLPSVGFAFGHMDQTGNSSVDGEGLTAQFIGTYYYSDRPWIVDAGVGFHKQYYSGTEDNPIVGIVSVSGRYKLVNRISIGPVLDGLIGTSEDYGTANRFLSMVGIQGLREIPFTNDTLGRIGLKYATEVGIEEQTNNYIGLVFQWGVGSESSLIRSTASLN